VKRGERTRHITTDSESGSCSSAVSSLRTGFDEFHRAALQVNEKIRMRIKCDEDVALLNVDGCTVVDGNMVRITIYNGLFSEAMRRSAEAAAGRRRQGEGDRGARVPR